MSAEQLSKTDTGYEVMPCRYEDPELFFPLSEGTINAPSLQALVALAVCARCLVRDACLERALHYGEETGIWGGTTGPQRERILQRRGR